MRTDDTTQDSEETATAFTVSQSSHNSRTSKSMNQIQENVAKRLLVFVALQPLSSYSCNRHTHSQLYHIPRAATSRGIKNSLTMCTKPPLNKGHLCIMAKTMFPKGVCYRGFHALKALKEIFQMMCFNQIFRRGPNLSFFGLGPWAIIHGWPKRQTVLLLKYEL